MYIVMGTPGAGKSTVIKEFKARHPDAQVFNFGTVMFEIAQKEYGIANRDEMRKMRRDKFRELQSRAANELMKMGKGIIIDTHASINTADGFYPGMPNYVLSKLTIDSFIYVHASVETVLSRRLRDTTRRRDIESLQELRFHESVNLAMVCSYASYVNAPIKFIINEDGKLEEAIKQFEECVRI